MDLCCDNCGGSITNAETVVVCDNDCGACFCDGCDAVGFQHNCNSSEKFEESLDSDELAWPDKEELERNKNIDEKDWIRHEEPQFTEKEIKDFRSGLFK